MKNSHFCFLLTFAVLTFAVVIASYFPTSVFANLYLSIVALLFLVTGIICSSIEKLKD